MRIVAGAFENLLLRDPYTDLAAGMRADRRIGDHALCRALLRDADQRRGIEPEQEHFVEARATANDIGGEVHRPCQHRRAACRNVLGLKGRLTFAFDCDQHVPFFRPLVRPPRQDRATDGEMKAKDRCDREKIAARGAIDITAIAAATPAFPDLAHLSRTGASNGLNSSYYSKSLGEIHAAGPEHVWCGGVEEPDHRQHPLLRARRNRPRSRCAAEQRDEVASSHVPLAAHFHCFTEPVGHGGLRCSANPPYRAAPHAYYFT